MATNKQKFLLLTYTNEKEIEPNRSGFVDSKYLRKHYDSRYFSSANYDWDNDSPNGKSGPIPKFTINGLLCTKANLEEFLTAEGNAKILEESDWIVAKIQEASILGEDTAPLLTKYNSDLQARKIARAALDDLPSYTEADEIQWGGKGVLSDDADLV